MIERSARVRNAAGIHCRPATTIVESVKDYEGSLRVRHAGDESDLRSVMDLMSMGLEQGEQIVAREAAAGAVARGIAERRLRQCALARVQVEDALPDIGRIAEDVGLF